MSLTTRLMAGVVLTVAAHATASAQATPADRNAPASPKLVLNPSGRAQAAPAPDAAGPILVHVPERVPYMPVAVPDTTRLQMPVAPGGRLGSIVRFQYSPDGRVTPTLPDSPLVLPLEPRPAPAPRAP